MQRKKKSFFPVIRAIVLHLWLAYDHPFEDGNGRTARALFYWSMLNSGYWLLGQIVNEVTGVSMAQFADQEIFLPLGMKHTHFRAA